MFALSHDEPLAAETHSAPSVPRVRAAHVWAVRSVSFALAAGIAATSALLGSHVLFGQDPIGGSAGLFSLYAATAVIGIGLAVLFQLAAFARRLTDSLQPPAKVISIALPASAETTESEWAASRPFNAA